MNTLTKRSVAALVAGSALIGSFALAVPAFAAETAGAKPTEVSHASKSVTGTPVRTVTRVRTGVVKTPEKRTEQKPAPRATHTVKAPKTVTPAPKR